MAIPETRQSAQSLVEQIARDHGYLGEEKLRRIEPELRREIEEALLKKDLMIGSTVITLAKNLYTSKARFVFELLQNADDNSYTRANRLGSIPYVSFRVYPRRIVLDCNEDGFNHKNLAAICSVGQSSKTGAQGYIGEKGIGFKSVFMAAWKVHIQSGNFSFSFTHRTGDSGMGMISPLWEDDGKEILESPLTRITLHLHETGDNDILARSRQTIQEQFEELQETVLLFMKNLKNISVAFYNEREEQTSSAMYSVKRPRSNYAVLERTRIINNETETVVKYFHVTAHEVTNLAKNENRNYSENEEATRAYSKSKVLLAFPLSKTSMPVIAPQDLFVFLPVRQVGFKFLIQADFVTDASRQDVVKDSSRNFGLLVGIAEAFTKAILQFCEHDTLRYHWMKYLPENDSTVRDSFWISLINDIRNRLCKVPVLFGRRSPNRRLISALFRLNDDGVDENGEPLFDDEESEKLISQHYDNQALEVLGDYGLRFASYSEIREWLRNDLRRGPESRMKSSKTSENWHTRAAKLLQRHFMSNSTSKERSDELKRMDILPLDDGTWVSASAGSVYFAQTNGIDIPSDIGIQVLSKSVVNNSRMKLFKSLGVQVASIPLVRKKILKEYPWDDDDISPSLLSASKRHLEFLYLSHHLKGDDADPLTNISIFDDQGKLVDPFYKYTYVSNNEPYGPWELFRETDPGPKPGDGAPGYDVRFINEAYFENSPKTPQSEHLTWMEWLYSEIDIETQILLGSETLSGFAIYLQKYRPEKFLGFLHSEIQGGQDLLENLVDPLRETEVLCRGNRQYLLKNTYFPTKELERRVERYVEHGAFFPWLWLDTEATPDAIPSDWKSLLAQLKIFSPPTDLDFALDMLKYSLDTLSDVVNSSSRNKLFELYGYIQARCREDENHVAARGKIRILFSEKKCIYIPLTGNRCTWAFPDECVWNAPQELKSKYALAHLYQPWLLTDGTNHPYLRNLFITTLRVARCTWKTYIQELKALSDSGCDNIDTVNGIYTALDTLRSQIIGLSKDEFKSAFEENALIYLPSDDGRAWHKASQCVWSNAARLRERVSLNDEYENLEELFVKLIGVKPVDLLMAIDELKEVGNRQSISEEEVKESIWTVNSLLSTESRLPSSQDVVNSRIFPIRHPNGGVTLGSKTKEFFIVDREPFRRTFESKVKFLDFTLEEVAQLRPFFEWTDLGTRYLSHCVKEITSFHSGVAIQTANSDRQIRNRAHALLRIASHFNSPRLQNRRNSDLFYQILGNANIFETNGISSGLSLSQDGVAHKVEGKVTTLHIDEDDMGLKIYVPSNKDDQEYTFTKVLSQRLFEWMMTAPLTQISEEISKDGVIATRDVMLAPRSRIARALEDNGIAAIDIANIDQDALSESYSPPAPVGMSEGGSEVTTPSGQEDSDLDALDTPASSMASLSLDRGDADDSARDSYFMPSTPRPINTSSLSRPSRPSTPRPITATTANYVETGDRKYIALLDKVINAGRRDTLPSHGETNPKQPQSNEPRAACTIDWGLRSVPQIERDCKVGAAGELYVFELLCLLLESSQLPGFSRNNWKSNVRKYVKVHPEYATMEPWTGSETSDIVYTDNDGLLTRQLIDKGYLAADIWAGRKPKFFIEVKTTTMTCETRFFMSKAQYQRMKDNALNAENRDTIYVVFRVYNLGQDNMGVKIYLDPESLRLTDQLRFTAETWSIVPRSS